jgi:hypothetical protein
MSTRTTSFEDRLLAELKREIGLREADAGSAETDTPVHRPRSPLLTPRRITFAAAACAVAGLAMVVVPGTSGESAAYAVEPVGNDTVKLSVKDQTISPTAQLALAQTLSPWGIQVTVDVLDAGYVCERSKVPALPGIDAQGNLVPIIPVKASWDFTLRRGNVLAFENARGDSRPQAVTFYRTKSEVEPCVPVKVTLPDA